MSELVYDTIRFTLNGREVSARVQPHWTLIDLLQESFSLFGARQSCGQGICGCCTVLVDGKAVSGCLYLASLVDGRSLQTVEHGEEELDAVQEAFIEAGGFQCGFCTPGFIMMTRQLLATNPDPSKDEIKLYLAGNLCRCGAYPQIIEAVQNAARKLRHT